MERKRTTRSSTTKVATTTTKAKPAAKTPNKKQKVEPTENGNGHIFEDGIELIVPKAKELPELTEAQVLQSLTLPPADIPSQTLPRPIDDAEEETGDLPQKFHDLKEAFSALLSVYMYLKPRKQNCTWSLVRQSVESLTNKRVVLSHIAQMQTVIPGAVKLEVLEFAPTTVAGENDVAIEISSPTTSEPLNHAVATQLKQTFHQNLLKTVKQHEKSLQDAAKQKKTPRGKKATTSKFNIESVPDIIPVPLPSLAVRLQQSDTSNSQTELTNMEIDKFVDSKPIPEELIGLDKKTIAAAREAEESISEETDEELLKRRLPAVIRTLHGLCVSESKKTIANSLSELRAGDNKKAFAKVQLIDKMVSTSSTPLSVEEAEQAIARLLKVLPAWISQYRADDADWIRFNKGVRLAECLAAVKTDV